MYEQTSAAIEARVAAASRDQTRRRVGRGDRLLSGLTRVAGVVAVGKSDARLKQIDFVRLEPERVLAILVAEDGSVENRVLPVRAIAALGANRGGQLSQRPHPRPHVEEARAEIDASRRRRGRRNSTR